MLLRSACMADNESLCMMLHCKEFSVICSIKSRFACSAENIQKEDGRMRCWKFCERLVAFQTTSSAFLDPLV